MHICVVNLTIIGSDNAWSAPSHYQNQCWNIVNSNFKNKFQWNFNLDSYIFIQENAIENVVCEMASILSQPQCVKIIYGLTWIPIPIFCYSWDDSTMIFTHDFVTRESHCQITSLVTKNRYSWPPIHYYYVYFQWRINSLLSFFMKDFKYLCHLGVDNRVGVK